MRLSLFLLFWLAGWNGAQARFLRSHGTVAWKPPELTGDRFLRELDAVQDASKEHVLKSLEKFPERDLEESLHVSSDGHFFYEESLKFSLTPSVEQAPALTLEAMRAAAPVVFQDANMRFDANGTPLLHSKKGSANTIFLDFDGHDPSAEQRATWSYTGEPWEGLGADHDPAFIAGCWARASEDFSSWDIDVTTEAPPPTALQTNPRIAHVTVIKSREGMPYPSTAGVAYVNVFGTQWAHKYGPAIVYYNNLNNVMEYVAEAISHVRTLYHCIHSCAHQAPLERLLSAGWR